MESKAGPFLASGEDQAMNLSMAYLAPLRMCRSKRIEHGG